MFGYAHSCRRDRSKLNQTGIKTSVDPTVKEPFVNTYMTFNSVQVISRQKNLCAWQREGRKQRLFIVDVVPFCRTEKLIYTLHSILTV